MSLKALVKSSIISDFDISKEDFFISTSNSKKIQEIKKSTYIPIIKGVDLPEIKSDDALLVAVHKAIDFYNQTLVEKAFIEDTIIEIEGEPITDIKFVFSTIKENITEYLGKKVSIRTIMASVIDSKVFFIEGVVNGLIGYENDDGYVFDPYFFVKHNGQYKSLAHLDKIGIKHLFHPRNEIVQKIESFIEGINTVNYIELKDIPKWNGDYQS